MLLTSIDLIDVAIFAGKQVLIVIALYLGVILVIRASGYYKLKKCPECGGKLKRASRGSSERMTKSFSFGLLPLKRYRCYSCYWEGAAFEIKKSDSETEEEESVGEESNEMTAV